MVEKKSLNIRFANYLLIIIFTCRFRLTLINHFKIKVKIIQIIVYIEGVKYIIEILQWAWQTRKVRAGKADIFIS